MEILQTIFYFVLTLGVLVTFHEFGHFWVARRCGVKVIRFSVGFGTPLLKWNDRQGTEYVVAALPLGGYVKMVDEREGEVAEQDLPGAFNRKSVWHRIAIVAAGPAANLLLAVLAYWLVFVMGVTGLAPIVGSVEPDSIAEGAGLQAGQEIVAVDGAETSTTQMLRQQLVRRMGESGSIWFKVKSTSTGDDDIHYELEGQLNGWLAEAEEGDPVEGLGIRLYQPKILPLVNKVMPDSPADAAGLLSGDLILAANDEPMASWYDWVDYVRARPNESIEVEFERDQAVFSVTLRPKEIVTREGEKVGQVGMTVVAPEWPEDMIRTTEYGPVAALGQAAKQTWETSVLILDSVKKMFVGLISAKHLSGPITIAKVAGASAQYGLSAYLSFLALLSVSLGVLNLLPIPVLDGGHLVYYLIEVVKGRPVSEQAQLIGFRIGLFFVVGLMILAFYNDLMRL